MPELPEVETVRQTLRQFILDENIEGIDVYYDKIINGDTQEFIERLTHQTIRDIDRVGKYLIFLLDEDAFVSHLRMEGIILSKEKRLSINIHTLFFIFMMGRICVI